jgi:hypothetical protein
MIPLSGYIRPDRGGTFTRLTEPEPGAIRAEFLYVRDDDLEVIDCIAWEPARPGTCWTERGLVTVLGEEELRWAWWDERAPALVETPRDWLACHGQAACIIDWSVCIDDLLHGLQAPICNTERLRIRLERTLAEQCRSPLSGRIRTATEARAA